MRRRIGLTLRCGRRPVRREAGRQSGDSKKKSLTREAGPVAVLATGGQAISELEVLFSRHPLVHGPPRG
ncbi:hypothetical protein, partial [Frankia sp. AvcI1]|uniref:hypothetical protein n=1 Tax=Frankia sp. AvcI1 TaxID=573496 RepID=UPI001F477E14